MTTDHDDLDQDGKEGGGALRKKLETALAENATFKSRLTVLEAQTLIAAKSYKLISPDDFKEVSLEDLPKRAEALELERSQLGKQALRQSLEARGLSGEDLETTVKQVFGESGDEAALSALDRIRAAGSTAGSPPSRAEDKDLYGPTRIRAALGK